MISSDDISVDCECGGIGLEAEFGRDMVSCDESRLSGDMLFFDRVGVSDWEVESKLWVVGSVFPLMFQESKSSREGRGR